MSFRILGIVGAMLLAALSVTTVVGADPGNVGKPLPAEVRAIFEKPLYKNGVWGLLVADLDSGEVIYDLAASRQFMTGSVRKVISIGLALEKLGPEHRFTTPIYRRGTVKDGVLDGDLILVASGDLTMGGRTNPDGTLAWTNYDHNEANSLGNAQLTAPDPLAGYTTLAEKVALAGIRKVTGDVIIDDRLFAPFNFRNEFMLRPIFVNDDVIDVTVEPTADGTPAAVDWRPKSAAFAVRSTLEMSAAGSELDIRLEPELARCFGVANCRGQISGRLPLGFVPQLTKKYPLVRTFRVVEPQNYARTVLIEALAKAGVDVEAEEVGKNASDKLRPRNSYADDAKVAELSSMQYVDYAKWILKVSYNIGADTSLLLYGTTQHADTMQGALDAEKKTLAKEFKIAPDQYMFVDGSGGGDSAATPTAIVSFLRSMREKPYFDNFRDCLPILATDGSLDFVTDFLKDPSLAGAKGKVHAKPGTYLVGNDEGVFSLKAQAFAGYIDAKSGRRLAYAVFVNDVSPVHGVDDVMGAFQDQGTISTIIWREN